MSDRFVINGDWIVEPRLCRLRGPSGRRQLEPKVMQVLVELARAAGEPVSTDQLLDRVWQTPYVTREVARRAIYELRKIFADSAEGAKFIETIPRVGYRLVASVAPVSQGDREARRKRWRLALVVAAVVGLGIAGWWLLRPPQSALLVTSPLTSDPGIETEPALSGDGVRLAFIKRDSAASDLYLQIVGETSKIRLASKAHQPRWTADGSNVLFTRLAEADGKKQWELWKAPSLGGTGSRVRSFGRLRPRGFDPSPDGRRIAIALAAGNSATSSLWVIDLETGQSRRLTEPPETSLGDSDPVWSESGSQIVFLRTLRQGVVQPWMVQVHGSARAVDRTWRAIHDIGWMPGGDEVVFSDRTLSEHALMTVAVEGASKTRSLLPAVDAARLAVDPDRGRLVYSRENTQVRFMTLSVDGGRSAAIPGLNSTRWDGELSATSNGDRLAFVSNRSGAREIWVASRDGSGIRRLTNFRGPFVGEPAWSRDELWVVFSSTAAGDADIWRVDARGGLPEQLTFDQSHELEPAFSPDADWLYFASDRSGRWEIWRLSLEEQSAAAEQFTTGGGFRAAVSDDGRWVYFSRRETPGLWRTPTDGGAPEQVSASLLPSGDSAWLVLGSRLFFTRPLPGGEAEILVQDLTDPRPEALARVTGFDGVPNLTVVSDQELVVIEVAERDGDLVLVEGLSGPG